MNGPPSHRSGELCRGVVMSLQEAAQAAESARTAGRRVVTTNGTFDLLHDGHRFLFAQARSHGDLLIVGVNSDASVRRSKGPDRPREPQAARARNVAVYADIVFVFDDDDPRPWLPAIRPHVHVNAATYGPQCVEAAVLRSIGAELVLVPVRPEFGSTTERLRRASRTSAHTARWILLTAFLWPALLILARFRRPASPPRILVIQTAKLGDLVATTPLFRAIKDALPEAELHVLARRTSAVALQGNPFVSSVHFLDDGSCYSLFARLRRLRFQWSIHCMPDAFGSLVPLWALVPRRVNTSSCRRGIAVLLLRFLHSWDVPYAIRTRTFDHYMMLLRPLGIPPIPYALDFFITAEQRRTAEAWMTARGLLPHSFVCLNLTAGNAVKEWPAGKFAELADIITDSLGKDVVLSTSDRTRAAAVRAGVHCLARVHDASALTLGEVAAVYRSSSAYISVDTGPLYVAYAVGAPVVVLLGPVAPEEQVPPEGPRVAHVPPPPGCKPWVFISLTPRSATPAQRLCIEETPVVAVVSALRRVMR